MLNNLVIVGVVVGHKCSNTLDNIVSNLVIIDFKSLSLLFKFSGYLIVDWWCEASAYNFL